MRIKQSGGSNCSYKDKLEKQLNAKLESLEDTGSPDAEFYKLRKQVKNAIKKCDMEKQTACGKVNELESKLYDKSEYLNFDEEYKSLERELDIQKKICESESNSTGFEIGTKQKLTFKVIFLIITILVIIYFLFNDGEILNPIIKEENREKYKEIFISVQFTFLIALSILLMERFNIKGYGKLLGGSLLLIGLFYVSKRIQNPILYYLLFIYILGKTIYPQLKKLYKGKSINMFIFYVICLYIIHILWVILTFTSPTVDISVNLPEDRVCRLPWLYYGVYPAQNFDLLDSINKYMFDITVWYPPDIVDDPSFTCQPCPTNMTAKETLNGGTRTTCRPCNVDEQWYSINQIYNRRNNGTLRPDEKDIITNDGMTKELDGHSEVPSFQTFLKDHRNTDDKFDKLGMCLPVLSSSNSMLAWGDNTTPLCPNYNQCMENSPAFIELNWPKNEDIRIFPNQTIEIKNLETNLTFSVPGETYLPIETSGQSCNTINPAYKDGNKYHNRICDESSVNHDTTNCHLKIPVPHTPVINTEPGIPETNFVVRHGGNSSLSGPPCDSSNQVAQDYLINQTSRLEISPFHINHNPLVNNDYMNSRNILNTGTNGISDDWRNIIGLTYDTCYQTNGQCYMDHSICQTTNKTPIPLTTSTSDTGSNSYMILTIPTASEIGCQNATVISGCQNINDNCDAMDVDSDGNLIDVDGICRMAKWENSRWNISQLNENNPEYEMRCFPTQKIDSYNGYILDPSKVVYDNSIFEDQNKFENMCKKIPRITYPSISYNITTEPPCSDINVPQNPVMTQTQINNYITSQVNNLGTITTTPDNPAIINFEKEWTNWSGYPTIPSPSEFSYPSNNRLFEVTPSPNQVTLHEQYDINRCSNLLNTISGVCCNPSSNCTNGHISMCPPGCLDGINEIKDHCLLTINNQPAHEIIYHNYGVCTNN